MFENVYSLVERFAASWNLEPWFAANALQLIADRFAEFTDCVTSDDFSTVEHLAYNSYAVIGEAAASRYLASEYDVILITNGRFNYTLMSARNGNEPETLHLLTDSVVYVVVETEC